MATVEIIRITGGEKLRGEVSVSGGKNAAVAIVPAALLARDHCVIENLPQIEDVHVMADMLRVLGAKVTHEGSTMHIDPTGVDKYQAPYDLARKMRASYYLVPVLMGLFGRAEVPMPGGCDIGARPIDYSIKGWEQLGAQVSTEGDWISVKADHLVGTDISLDFPSVGATVNIMLAAVTAEGNTTIFNAAKEPHIVDLANFLGSLGAWIKGAGTDVIRIRGGKKLHGSTYTVVPDQIETGTLMIAAAATGGDVVIRDAIPYHMEALSAKLLEMGVHVTDDEDLIHVRGSSSYRSINVRTQVYPGFPTDLQQPMTTLLTTAKGSSMITETIYESRFRFVDELRRMGARINVKDRVAIVEGVGRLTGAPVNATDLRAGSAMLVAGLMAEGETDISGVQYIRRGYENIEKKLRSLGAKIETVRREKD